MSPRAPVLEVVVWVALALAIGVAAVVGWGVTAAMGQTDRSAQAREERLVANGLGLRAAEIRKVLETETVWDDAVENLDLTWNTAWAQANLVQFFTTTSGFELVYVFDGQDRVRIAHEGALAASRRVTPPAMARLLREVRDKERLRGPIAPRSVSRTLISKPLQASEIAVIDGRIYVLAASLVQPDFGSRRPSARAPIVLVGEEIDAAFVRRMARYYMLDAARLEPAGTAAAPGWARSPLKDSSGRVLAYLSWRPQKPAADLAERIAAPAALLVALSLISALAFVMRERRQRRVLTEARAAAEQASEAKSAFLANMSHEVRTPLNGMMGMTQLLLQGAPTPEQKPLLDIILESCRGLATVLNDVLDLSKMEAGQLDIEIAEFDLEACLAAACRPFELARAEGVRFELIADESVRGRWLGDGGRLRQIVANLVGNAVKFTPQGWVRVSAAVENGLLTLTVSDSGLGIPRDRLTEVFEEYVQADPSTSRRFGGTGLGLPISRRLARMMGGAVTVDSVEGQGSTFRLTVPLQRAEARPDSAPPPPPKISFAGLQVLAADDNATNRSILRALLEPLGVALFLAEDGVEARLAGRRLRSGADGYSDAQARRGGRDPPDPRHRAAGGLGPHPDPGLVGQRDGSSGHGICGRGDGWLRQQAHRPAGPAGTDGRDAHVGLPEHGSRSVGRNLRQRGFRPALRRVRRGTGLAGGGDLGAGRFQVRPKGRDAMQGGHDDRAVQPAGFHRAQAVHAADQPAFPEGAGPRKDRRRPVRRELGQDQPH